MKDPDKELEKLSDQQLIALLKDLQKKFDNSNGSTKDQLLSIIGTFIRARRILAGRGHSELDVEWALYETPTA